MLNMSIMLAFGISFGFAIIIYAIITANLSGICTFLDILLFLSWLAILGSPWIAIACGFSWIPFAIGLGIFIPVFIWIGIQIGEHWH